MYTYKHTLHYWCLLPILRVRDASQCHFRGLCNIWIYIYIHKYIYITLPFTLLAFGANSSKFVMHQNDALMACVPKGHTVMSRAENKNVMAPVKLYMYIYITLSFIYTTIYITDFCRQFSSSWRNRTFEDEGVMALVKSYLCIYVYICVCTYVRKHIHIHMHVHYANTYNMSYIHLCVYVHMHIQSHVYYIDTYAYTCRIHYQSTHYQLHYLLQYSLLPPILQVRNVTEFASVICVTKSYEWGCLGVVLQCGEFDFFWTPKQEHDIVYKKIKCIILYNLFETQKE